jgi:hypothetical protein
VRTDPEQRPDDDDLAALAEAQDRYLAAVNARGSLVLRHPQLAARITAAYLRELASEGIVLADFEPPAPPTTTHQ